MKRSLITFSMLAILTTTAWADPKLASTNNCMACHTVERKRVGPAFQDIAKKYAQQADAAPYLANQITKGSRGVWGAIPMPANNHISEADAQKLATWILSLQ